MTGGRPRGRARVGTLAARVLLGTLVLAGVARAEPPDGAAALPFLGADGELRAIYRPEFRGAAELVEALAAFGVEGLAADGIGPWCPSPEDPAVLVPGRVLLRGQAEAVARAREVLRFLDVPRPAVLVSLLLAEVRGVGQRERGGHLLFDRGNAGDGANTLLRGVAAGFEPEAWLRSAVTGVRPFPGSSVHLGFVGPDAFDHGAFDLVLRMLEERRDAELLAWPTLLVTEGVPGSIRSTLNLTNRVVTDTSGLQVVTVPEESGIVLDVVPLHVAADAAELELTATLRIAEPSRDGDVPAGSLDLRSHAVSVRLTVRDQETLLVGGLHLRHQLTSSQGPPLVASVPVAGTLLRARNAHCLETELVVLVRARVLVPGRGRAPFLPPGEARRLERERAAAGSGPAR